MSAPVCAGSTLPLAESYIAEKVADRDASFLPRNTALVLQEAEQADAEAMHVVGERLDGIDRELEKIRRGVEVIAKEQGRQVADLNRREIASQFMGAGGSTGRGMWTRTSKMLKTAIKRN